jgi:hypothetical protein
MNSEQFSLVDANKLLHKSKETKINLVVKRNGLNVGSDDDNQNLEQQQQQQHQQQPYDSTDLTSIEQPNLVTQPPPQAPTRNKTTMLATPPDPQKHQQKQLFKPIKSSNTSNKFFSSNMGVVTKQANTTTTTTNNNNNNTNNNHLNLRSIIFSRDKGVGIRLAGGNKIGLFICDVQYNSPAEKAGLRVGDKIIKVNGTDYLTLTREEAVQHILNPEQNVIEMLVSHCREEYDANVFEGHGGDSLYVRAHFNLSSKTPNELSFKINDILHVSDTLQNGVIGAWVASKLGLR